MDPNCPICGDSYESVEICYACKEDPANVAWHEPKDAHAESEIVSLAGEKTPWNPTAKYTAITRALVANPYDPLSKIAKAAGVSLSYTKKVVAEVLRK